MSTYQNIFMVPGAPNSYSARGMEFCGARGTELLWYQRHNYIVFATTLVLVHVRSAKSFSFLCHYPSLDQSWGIPTLIVKSLLLNCDYLIGLCTFTVLNHLNFQAIFLVIFKMSLLQHMSQCIVNFARTCFL